MVVSEKKQEKKKDITFYQLLNLKNINKIPKNKHGSPMDKGFENKITSL